MNTIDSSTPPQTAGPVKLAASGSLEELDRLYGEAPLGLALLDSDLRFVRVNQQLAAVHGKPAAQHIGRRLQEIVPKQILEVVAPLLEDLIRTGKPFLNCEVTLDESDGAGEARQLRGSAYPLGRGNTEVSGICVMVRDVTDLARRKQELHEHAEFDELLGDISTAFVNATAEQIDELINTALERIGRSTNTDRSFVDQFSEDQQVFRVTHSWYDRDLADDPMLNPNESAPLEGLLPWYTRRMRQGRPLIFSSIDELPSEASNERRYVRSAGIQASIILPMMVGGSVIGNFGLDAMRVPRRWPDKFIQRLQVLKDILAAALMRQRQQRVIEQQLSFEKLVADISSRFVRVAPEGVDDQIQIALGELAEFLKSELATILIRPPESSTWRHSHEWLSPTFRARDLGFRDIVISKESFPWLRKKLAGQRPITISRVGDFPDEAGQERQTCEEFGIKSVLWVPFNIHGSVNGFIAFNALQTEVRWSEATVRRIGIIGEVFGNALARANAVAELERLNARLAADNVYLREEVAQSADFKDIVGRSEAFSRVLYQVDQVAPTETTVLLIGETGTGKELIARALHAKGNRAQRPLIKVNCAALPASLIESELFGHEKGAFTGASSKRTGRFTLADNATIFLDEVGDLPLELQAKLLRVLQDGEFEPLGSSKTIRVDARVIAATNRDLEAALESGEFRSDLYYRLNVFPISLPPLRARREDIPLLVWYFIDKLKTRLGKSIEEVPAEVMDLLCSYDWPGNVRELENVIERAMILSPSTRLRLKWEQGSVAESGTDGADDTLERVEREHILKVLDACGWKIKGNRNAAERLGLHPNTLRFRMGKLGIERPGRTPAGAAESTDSTRSFRID
jgi:PAS domain S-box-containing protein